MYERRKIARRTGSSAMRALLRVFNADLAKGQALPDFVKDEAERAEAARLQTWLVDRLAPILGFDPHQLVEKRRALLKKLIRDAADQEDLPAEELADLRRQLAQEPHRAEAAKRREHEDGRRDLVAELNEWAKKEEKLYPQWQLYDPTDKRPAPPAPVHAELRDRNSATVTQWLFCDLTLRNSMMLNLGACLASGELNRLRMCVDDTCRRYFFADDFRMKHCSEACRTHRDRAGASGRMQRYREKKRSNDAALERYFLAVLPKLHIRTLRTLAKQQVLNERQIDRLDGLREKLEEGTPAQRIWERSGPRIRGLFQQLQESRVL